MNRVELIDAVASKTNVTKANIAAVLSAMIDTIQEAVANGDKVTFIGFGTFEARKRSARTGRNPLTGETLTIEAKTVPAFKVGRRFKDAVK